MTVEQEDVELYRAAQSALRDAYAPYSEFAVGSAVRSGDGLVFTGVNVENASFGLSMCAERVAIFKAVSDGVRDLESIAIVAADDEPAPPCGACRQVMREFNPELRILYGPDADHLTAKPLAELLPDSFGPETLE